MTPVSAEFSDVDLGDRRLTARLVQMADAAERAPGCSLPEKAGSSAALEATYRFFGNAKVTPQAVFEGHVRATIRRAEAEPQVLVIHDTTEFRFGGDKHREGLGWINSTHRQGYLAHFSICVSPQGRPLGSLGLFAWSRQGKKKGRRTNARIANDPGRESLRWQDAAALTGEMLYNKTGVVHVMDREGDNFELLALMLEHEQRFVVRMGHDRRLEPGRGASATPKLFESLSETPFFFSREVKISARGKAKQGNKLEVFPARESRVAHLEVRAGSREIFINHNAPAHLPRSLTLQCVEVRENAPPKDEAPIIWRIVTTEPVGTEEQVATIVDAYRSRWLIEEFFKALKTGCRYQQLQLENSQALLVALAIESAVAWRMLLLRWVAHHRPDAPASDALPQEQIVLLETLVETETNRTLELPLTVRTVFLEIARLGGHIKNNGPPGWLILRRGFDKLLTIHRGWILANGAR